MLRAAAGAVTQRLYIGLAGDWGRRGFAHANRRLSEVYSAVPAHQDLHEGGALDVRVLLPADWSAAAAHGSGIVTAATIDASAASARLRAGIITATAVIDAFATGTVASTPA